MTDALAFAAGSVLLFLFTVLIAALGFACGWLSRPHWKTKIDGKEDA